MKTLRNILGDSLSTPAPAVAEIANTGGLESLLAADTYAEASAELTLQYSAIDELEEMTGGLEALADFVGTQAEKGGLDSQAASLVAMCANAHLAPAGATIDAVMPGNESFEDEAGRGLATTAGLEAIGDTIKKVWETIMNFLKDLKKKIMNFYDQNFSLAGRVNSNAASLAKAELKGEPKEKTVTIGAAVGNMMIDEKVVGVDAIKLPIFNMKGTEAAVKSYASALAGLASKLTAETLTEIEQAHVEILEKAIDAYDAKESVSNDDRFEKGLTILRSKEMPGGKAVFCVKPDDAIEGKAINELLPKLLPVDPKAKVDTKAELEALDAAGITDLAKAVEALSKGYLDTVKAERDVADSINEVMVKTGNDLSKALDKADKGAVEKVKGKYQLRNIRAVASGLTRPATQVRQDGMQVLSALLKYAQASKSNLEEKKEDK